MHFGMIRQLMYFARKIRESGHSMIETIVKRNLTEREVNATYGLGIRQLREMRMRGNGPKFIKVSGTTGRRGGRVLYPVVSLERWLASCPAGGEQ
jgi:hypothetical protein